MKTAKQNNINIFLAFLGIGLFLFTPVLAQDNNLKVEFEKTPLFDEVNFLPGQSVIRLVKVTNNSGQPQRIAVEAINWPEFPEINNVPEKDLSRALNIVIREKGGSDLYGGSSLTGEKTLFDFYQDNETYLSSDIPTGSFKEYEFEVIFPAEKEKEWQAATTTFDILVGFQGTGGQVPPGGGGGGGGLPPGLTIQYERDFYVGVTTAKISWLTSYNATSRVIYDTVAGVFDLNSLSNYGYAFSTPEEDTPANTIGVTYHEVEITGLTPNTTYYFRCVSHGSFAVSVEHSFTTLAAVVGGEEEGEEEEEISQETQEIKERAKEVGGIVEGEAEKAGEAENNLLGTPQMNEIQEQEQKEQSGLGWLLAGISNLLKIENLWWLLVLFLIIVFFLFLFSRKKKK